VNCRLFGLLSLLALTLSGCSGLRSQPEPTCQLMTTQICSRAAEAKMRDGTLVVSYSFRPEEARVVPIIVPILRGDGVLAAEVDCYANTNSHSYSIVKSDLAIAPESEASVDFLRERHMCTDAGEYADSPLPVQTASALAPSFR